MNEDENRISDEAIAFTAARAEDAMRSRIIPEAKKALSESEGNIGDQKVWDVIAEKAGAERVANYNPEEEAKLEELRKSAVTAVERIGEYLKTHPRTHDNNLLFQSLNKAKEYLEVQIGQIDIGIGPHLTQGDARMFHPENAIPQTLKTVETIFSQLAGK